MLNSPQWRGALSVTMRTFKESSIAVEPFDVARIIDFSVGTREPQRNTDRGHEDDDEHAQATTPKHGDGPAGIGIDARGQARTGHKGKNWAAAAADVRRGRQSGGARTLH